MPHRTHRRGAGMRRFADGLDMIDLAVILIVIWAIVMGIRRGLVIQLCHMVGLYLAIIVASRYARAAGSLFVSDPGTAATVGFCLIVAVIMLAVWIVAPMIRSVVVWRPVRRIDALLGAVVSVAASLLILGALFSVFDRANVDSTSISTETLRRNPEAVRRYIETGEISSHELFRSRYVDFDVLEKSFVFYPLAHMGRAVCPSLAEIDRAVREAADEYMRHNMDGYVPSQTSAGDVEE